MPRQWSNGLVSRADFAKSPSGALTLNGSAQTLMVANPRRAEFTVTNNGAAACWLSLGGVPASNTGIRLNSGGGSYTTNAYTGEVSVIGTAADVVSFVEI